MDKPKESLHSCIPSEKNSVLINEVKKFPALYDTSDPNYYVLAERNKAWLQVAENCNVPAEHCHLRWKSLRKRYAKERRKFKEILDGQRRPWALFPKMSFLASSTVKGRMKSLKKRKVTQKKNGSLHAQSFKQNASDDDMLILDDNNEIVTTCKTAEMADEDEYIYEHLDDPDSALEIMKKKPNPTVKQTAIRTGGTTNIPTATRIGGSGRIRKLTPKMQNSMIAKKLKQAQEILQQSKTAGENSDKSKCQQNIESMNSKQLTENKPVNGNSVLHQDKTRYVATVNPNIVRVGQTTDKEDNVSNRQENTDAVPSDKTEPGSAEKKSWSVKVIKLKGRNPIIFSPDELPKFQSFLKADPSLTKDESEMQCPPLLKIKSVENLNNTKNTSLSMTNDNGECSNLDIIHSVGLMRKQSAEKCAGVEPGSGASHQSYSRAYSWNRPCVKKTNKRSVTEMTEKTQPDSQTRDYEIEETWNDIKEENIDDEYWSQYQDNNEDQQCQEDLVQSNTSSPQKNTETWNKLSEAKLDLISFQRKLLEEQHRKSLEYMKKEHELKMTLLRAEIDLKRKQLNIML